MSSLTIMGLLFKRLTEYEIFPLSINFYFFLFTTIAFFIFMLLSKNSFSLPQSSIWIFFGLAIFAIGFNYFHILAIKHAPNPGFVDAIVSFKLVSISLISVILFGSELTVKHTIGIIFVVIGLILIVT